MYTLLNIRFGFYLGNIHSFSLYGSSNIGLLYTAMLYIMFSSLESTLLYITLSHHLTQYVQFLSSLNRPGQCHTHFVFCTLSGSRMVQVAATEHWQLNVCLRIPSSWVKISWHTGRKERAKVWASYVFMNIIQCHARKPPAPKSLKMIKNGLPPTLNKTLVFFGGGRPSNHKIKNSYE